MKSFLLRTALFVVLFLFGLLCLLVSLTSYNEAAESKTWQKLNATVATVSFSEEMGSKGMTYCPLVNVTFELNGQQYTYPLELSKRPCRSSLESVERSVATLREGKVIEIRVDPAKRDRVRPSTYSLGGGFFLGVFLGTLAFIGAIAVLVFPAKKSVKLKRRESISHSTFSKKEVQEKARELLAAGTAKSEVFSQLSGRGVKDSHLAYFIASYADPIRCYEHDRKVNILITIMLAQALMAFFWGMDIGARMGPTAKWVVGVSMTLIPLFLVWGFYNHRVGAYNAYIILTLPQLPRSLQGFASSPTTTIIALAISIVILAFVWYVRRKIFPDFVFVNPRKINGKYLFTG
ncbi:DUF3592 domain-containing protein [Pseudomonas sp. R37(2017)]|uniref:DUF3592 domain-containing protein n=1 Tax=Pseudomonas sp. R37(2017) TaxID=1981685 RepID=UPI000A1D889C|nr:DUF3592 domain-containing protein [Pseudomonas sp. R37(2017)]